MKIKLFDFEHEKDLENALNDFLASNIKVIDIKYQISHFSIHDEQIYSYSAMVIYVKKD